MKISVLICYLDGRQEIVEQEAAEIPAPETGEPPEESQNHA